MNRWLRRGLIAAAAILALAALRFTVLRPAAVPVTVFEVSTGTVESTVTNSRSGTVKSRRRAKLSPGVAGTVVDLPVRKGSRVLRGALLLRIDDREYRAQATLAARALDAARAGENEACLAADQAERELARKRPLSERGLISPELFEQVLTQRDIAVLGCTAARERTRQAESARKAAEAALARTEIRAPFDGVVAELTTERGEWVSPSPPGVPIPAVIDLIDVDSIYVSAPLDEVDVGRVKVGLPVRITMDSYPGSSFPGRVSRVAPYVLDVQEQNRTFEVEADFETGARSGASADPRFLPGTSADVEVILEARESVLRVPTYALLEGNRVLVVRKGGLVGVTVETGLRNWNFTEVVGGLAAGERVVVSLDRVEVKEGARVRIAAETSK